MTDLKLLTIGIDVDGTLGESIQAALDYLKSRGKALKISPNDINSWNFKINGETISEFLIRIYEEEPEFAKNVLLMENAREEMLKIKERYDVLKTQFPEKKNRDWIIIMTARHDNAFETTKEWLDKNKICYDSIQFMSLSEKAETSIDVLIEDSTKTAVKAARNGITVLYHLRPYNQDLSQMTKDDQELFVKYKTEGKIIPCKNWKEIGKRLEEIQKI